MKTIKENLAIVLAFALPIVLILVVWLSVYIPSLLVKTNYNFVYAVCDSGDAYYGQYCQSYLGQRYSVVDGVLKEHDVEPDLKFRNEVIRGVMDFYSARIFLHDTQKNESREIRLAEAQQLELNTLLTSPDGVTISDGRSRNSGDFFYLFDGGGSTYGQYLVKGNSRKKMNIIGVSDYYSKRDGFDFLGWVIE